MERTRRTKRLGLVALLALTAVLVSGCSTDEVVRFGWPQGITPQAARMRELWSWSVITALAVGVIVWGLIFWTTTFHRKKEGSPEFPRQTQYNLPLEIIYTIVPFVMVAVLFYFTVVTQNFVDKKIQNPDVEVNVTAFQWNWDFSYPGHTTPGGQDVSTVGSSSEIPLLVVPTGKIVQFTLASQDVIHGFYVPEFLFKRDVFPRPERNNTDNVVQIGPIEQAGGFVGRCTEMCGTYHSMMNFELRAIPDNLYQQYIGLRTTTNPASGAPYTAAEAFTQMNCGDLCSPVATKTHPFNTDTTTKSASVAAGS